jgi:hypothetical protein
MRELPRQLAEVARSLAATDLVRSVLLEPPLRLALGQPAEARPEVPYEEVDRLLGVDRRRARGRRLRTR